MEKITVVEFYGIFRRNTKSYEIFKVLSYVPYFFQVKSWNIETCEIFLECTACNSYNPMSAIEAIDIIISLLKDCSNFKEVLSSVYPDLKKLLKDDNVVLNITLNNIPLGSISKETTSQELYNKYHNKLV